MEKLITIAILSMVVTNIGCRSFSSTPLTRTEQDNFHGDSNGLLKPHCRTRPTKGVPVTVKLTTHTDVTIFEDYFVEIDPANPEKVREPVSETRMFRVKADPVQSEKIIIVDFKRPAAGTLDATLEFNEEQFFKKVTSSIQDETITESAKLLKTALTIVKPKSAGEFVDSVTDTKVRKKLERVVAYQRFDVNDPTYEEQMDAFIMHHLNKCNQCGTLPTYDQQGYVANGMHEHALLR